MKKLLYTVLLLLWGTSTHAIKLVNEMESEVTFHLVIYAKEPVYNYVSVESTKLAAKPEQPKAKAVTLEWPIESKIQSLKDEGEDVHEVYFYAKRYVTFGTYFGNRPNEWRDIECKERIRDPYRGGSYRPNRIAIPLTDYTWDDAVCTDNICGWSKNSSHNETFVKNLESLKKKTIKIERHEEEVHWEAYPVVIPYMVLEQ